MRIELVTDGKLWAIKRRSFFNCIDYYDLVGGGFWWSANNRYFHDCWAEKDVADKWFARLTA